MSMELKRFLPLARGDELADVVLRHGRVVNVYTGEIIETDIALSDDTIVGLGTKYQGLEEVDLQGRYVCPGLIDAHVHIESSMVTPYQFARATVPRGTTTVVTDPHEIANVIGTDGIRYMLAASEGLPLTVFVNLPSCVPATHMGTSGATLTVDDLLSLAYLPRVLGLAEFMNVPGAVLGLPGAIEKLQAFQGKIIDGHAPGTSGQWLQAYVGAGPGSDHEATTPEEMMEKLRLGVYIFVREATGARNLRALVPAITAVNSRRCGFSADDRHPTDLLDDGHIDHFIRLSVSSGVDPITALQMATLNAAEAFGLRDRGAIAPRKRADLVVFGELTDFHPEMVYSAGRLVARDGVPVGNWVEPRVDQYNVSDTVCVNWRDLDLQISAPAGAGDMVRARVIGIVPDQLVTKHLSESIPVSNGQVAGSISEDILKIAVIERHAGTGNVGLGFVRGFGLIQGALAGSVGHDSHNMTVVGCDDGSMLTAAHAVADMGGGLVAAQGEHVLASVPLPIAGLMSDRPLEEVRIQMDQLINTAHEMGSTLHDPLMTLSFLALEVIPSLKLTDQGLVDVERFSIVPLWVD
jgi:adenine deaminase